MSRFNPPKLLALLFAVCGYANDQNPEFGKVCGASAACPPGNGVSEEEVAFLQTGVQHTVIGHEHGLVGLTHAGSRYAVSKASSTTTQTFANEAMKVSKIKVNAAGDLPAFIRSIALDTGAFFFFMFIFMVLGRWYPQVYCLRVFTEPDGPMKNVDYLLTPSWFGWANASLFDVSGDQVLETSGLDAYLLIKFTHLAIELMLALGIPLCIVMIPIFAFGSGGFAGGDKLSWAGVGNVVYTATDAAHHTPLTHDQLDTLPNVQWIWWFIAFVTWVVVIWVQYRIFQWQRFFVVKRTEWLLKMPAPRSTTVLVEGIPSKHCDDTKFKQLFEKLFGEGCVENAFVVKKIAKLDRLISSFQSLAMDKQEVEFQIKNNPGSKPQFMSCCGRGGGDKLAYYTEAVETTKAEILAEQEEIQRMAKIEASDSALNYDSIYSYNGFVTFKERKVAEQCLNLMMDTDENTLVMTRPPDAEDVLYYGLQIPLAEETCLNYIGYAALIGLFFAFLPIVLAIADLASIDNIMKVPLFAMLINATGLKSTLSGVLASLGLTIMMSFLPTFLKLIFTYFFSAKSLRWDQLRLQRYYFWYLVVFVLLITAVGSDLPATMAKLAKSPFSLFTLLADKLPLSTHFYLNYVVMQPLTHGMNLTRYMNFIKYMIFKRICAEEVAVQRCEPEDQDYYGMGSRSARFTLMLIIGLVFGTICPLMNVVVLWNFMVCRLVYGYLIPCAEQRKVDMGGMHWDLQMSHLSLGVLIYIVLMTGILLTRAESKGPGIIAAISFVFWVFSYHKFRSTLHTESLSYVAVAEEEADPKHKIKDTEAYGQHEIYVTDLNKLLDIQPPK